MKQFIATLLCWALSLPSNAATTKSVIAGPNYGQMLLSLLVVIAAILLLAWLLKKIQSHNGANTKHLKVLASLNLSNRERVAIIQAVDKQLVIGISASNINTLHVFEQPVIDDTNATASSDNFSSIFAKVLNRGNAA